MRSAAASPSLQWIGAIRSFAEGHSFTSAPHSAEEAPIATTDWTGGSGNWTDPNWTDGVPDASLDAIVNGASAAPITLTFDTPGGAAHSLTMAFSTLAMLGGALALGAASSLDALTQSDGVLDFAAGGTIGGPLSQTGGTIENDAGTLLINDGASFAGALTGAGEITFAAGNVTLESGLGLSVASLVVANSATLAGDITDTGAFTLAAEGTLDLAGHVFTVNDSNLSAATEASLSGLIVGSGTFALEGPTETGNVNGLATAGTLTIADDTRMRVDGPLTLGTAATDRTTLTIGAHGLFDLQQGAAVTENGAVIINVSATGFLQDTAQSGTITLAGDVNNSGNVELYNDKYNPAIQDELLFSAGTFTNNGSVSAEGGTIAFGPDVTVTNLVNGTLTGDWSAAGGTIAFIGSPITTDAGTITLDPAGVPGSHGASIIAAGNGTSFTTLQHSLSNIAQGGVLDIEGGSYITNRNLVDNGTLDFVGGTGQFGTLAIGATGSLQVFGTLTAASIRNAGTISVPLGETARLKAPFASIGTMEVNGTMIIDSPTGSADFLGGTIGGDGTLELYGGTSTTVLRGIRTSAPGGEGFGPAIGVEGGAMTFDTDLVYHGNFGAGAGSRLNLNGHTIKIADGNLIGDPAASAVVDGGGTLVELGARGLGYVTFSGGTEFANNGTVKESGPVILGDASGGTASIVNRAGATYAMVSSVGDLILSAADPTADTVSNAGLFVKSGRGTAIVGADFTNTGTISVHQGTLEITGAFTNTGSIIGTEIQSNGTTIITAPSPALLNQYASAMDPPAASPLVASPSAAPLTPTLAAPHAA